MAKPKLYIFIGYPGAGKTTIAKRIAEETGAVHLWADLERHKLFSKPTHTLDESAKLYKMLNDSAEYLLAQGKSVVFDTNFNFFTDRQKLRDIAEKQSAETVLIWVRTPLDTARERAISEHETRNGYTVSMTAEQFNAIVAKLEPPAKYEKVIKINGTKVDDPELIKLLQQ